MQALCYLMIAMIFLVSCQNLQEEPSKNTATQINQTIATTQLVGL